MENKEFFCSHCGRKNIVSDLRNLADEFDSQKHECFPRPHNYHFKSKNTLNEKN